MDDVKCVECGCIGNGSCGHAPLDTAMWCGIPQDDDTCGCCAIDPRHMDYKPEVDGQQELING